MNAERDRALTLAHEAEPKDGYAPPENVVARARQYLDFLLGTRDAEIIKAAKELQRQLETRPTQA
jgi:hypothetical protein